MDAVEFEWDDPSSALVAKCRSVYLFQAEVKSRQEILEYLIEIVGLLKNLLAKELQLSSKDLILIIKVLRPLTGMNDSLMNASVFRCVRYILSTEKIEIKQVFKLSIDLVIIRSLERENKYILERMEAFKLIKQMIKCGASLSSGILRSLAAISIQKEDSCRGIALELLRVSY